MFKLVPSNQPKGELSLASYRLFYKISNLDVPIWCFDLCWGSRAFLVLSLLGPLDVCLRYKLQIYILKLYPQIDPTLISNQMNKWWMLWTQIDIWYYNQWTKTNNKVIWRETAQLRKGMFTPLVFTTTRGIGNECSRLIKILANLIANKTGESCLFVCLF